MTDAARMLSALLKFAPSSEQLAAITYPLAPGLVLAGAGTGKTTVMAARVAWLVHAGVVAPERVLGLTFTKKAAGELATRVRELLPHVDAEPSIATYHSFARDLIITHGVRIGIDAQPDPLDEPTAFQLARSLVGRIDELEIAWHSNADTLATAVIQLDAELAEHLIEPGQLDAHTARLLAAIAVAPRATSDLIKVAERAKSRLQIVGLVESYRTVKLERGLLDFGDYMRFGARVAAKSAVVAAMREQFEVVLLDEYQDTSYAQEQILQRLFGAGHAITAVGDPHQSIYGFRGASAANMVRFPSAFGGEFPARTFPLTENRRSDVAILTGANRLTRDLRVSMAGEALIPREDALPGRVAVALLEREDDEITWTVDQIAAFRSTSTEPNCIGTIAVLSRTRSGFPALYRALTERGIPVEVVGLGGLLEVPDIAELVAVLRLLADPGANPSLLRLLRGPRWRIGQRDLRLLAQRASQIGGGAARRGQGSLAEQLAAEVDTFEDVEVVALLDALDDPGDAGYDPEARDRFAELSNRLLFLRSLTGLPLVELVHRIAVVIGLEAELAVGTDGRSRRNAYGKFLDKVATFTPLDGPPTISALLAWFDVHSGREDDIDRELPDDAESVQLMTIHAAKGLEFDFVALPFVSKDRFPVRPSGDRAARWPMKAARLPHELRGDAAALPVWNDISNAGLKRFNEDSREHEIREERRLMYVATTRARHVLVACGSWWGPTQVKPRGPSEFLVELAESADILTWTEPPDVERNPYIPEPESILFSSDGSDSTRRGVAESVRALVEHRGPQAPTELSTMDPTERVQVESWDQLIDVLLQEERAARNPDRVVRLPERLSTSQVIELATDPDRFARDLYRPTPRAGSGRARRGTAFHAWLAARFGSVALIDPEELPGAADQPDPELEALIAAFESLPYAEREPVAIEEPVVIRLAGRTIVGRIDAVFRDGDRWEVIDWKTGCAGASDLQLGIYRLAWAEANNIEPHRVVGRFVYVTTGQIDERNDLVTREQLELLLVGATP